MLIYEYAIILFVNRKKTPHHVNPIFASLIKHKRKRKPGNGATQTEN